MSPLMVMAQITSKSGDVGLTSTAENVNVTAAKDVDLNATKAIKLDGDTAVTVTSKSGTLVDFDCRKRQRHCSEGC